jgi:hypothetical protein
MDWMAMATTDKLYIGNEMAQFDLKNRDFFDDLSDEEKKKFSPYLMIRWGSVVDGGADIEAYYLLSTNEKLNKHYFDVSGSQHKKLQWLLATTVSPGIGRQRHNWLAGKKKESGGKAAKFLREIYPHLKEDEIELLRQLNNADDLKDLAKQHGWTREQIKQAF